MSADASGSSGDAAKSKRAFPGATAAADGDERRVQPRHFHDGPNPTAAADAAVPASSTGAAGGPPPATRLHRHALECIFAFLGRGDLVSALQVSRDWLAAVQSMACMQWRYSDPSAYPLRDIVESAMVRHFMALGDDEAPIELNADCLWILARHMAQVRRLTCELSLSPSQPGPAALLFPAALEVLDLDVQAPVIPAQVNATIQGVGRLPLLESFTIRLPVADAQISFAPLAALPQLRDLSITWPSNGNFSDAQVDQMRSMPNLSTLQIRPMRTRLLHRLLRRPHSLQWQQINSCFFLDDETTQCLASLPLTQLTGLVECTRFDWLQRLPNLTVVNIFQAPQLESDRIDSLVAALQHCTQIQRLELTGFDGLTAAHLADLLPHLSQLDKLMLEKLRIDSLAFLAQQPTAQRLTHLELRECTRLPLAELRHVHALRRLETLIIDRSFNQRMDDLSHSSCAAVLPLLKEFTYTAPEPDSDDEDDDA